MMTSMGLRQEKDVPALTTLACLPFQALIEREDRGVAWTEEYRRCIHISELLERNEGD
jgi:hypothetical protein